MPRQLVLSVGLHKTGTTSLQRTCARSKGALLDAGFLYPEFAFDGMRNSNHSGALHFMFRTEPAEFGFSTSTMAAYERAKVITFRDRFRELMATRALAQPTNLLMVAEGVSVFSADELRQMRSWFYDRGWTIRVVCCVRWLSSWLNSMICQRVTGDQRLSIEAAICEFAAAGGLVRRRLSNIREVFPDAEIHSYEAGLQHRLGPVGYFLESVGIRNAPNFTFVKANEGRSDAATRLLSFINQALGPRFVEGREDPRFVENASCIAKINAICGPKFSLRRSEVAPLLPLLAAENAWLRETLGDSFFDPALAFGEKPCAWTREGLAQLREILRTATPLVRSGIEAFITDVNESNASSRRAPMTGTNTPK